MDCRIKNDIKITKCSSTESPVIMHDYAITEQSLMQYYYVLTVLGVHEFHECLFKVFTTKLSKLTTVRNE